MKLITWILLWLLVLLGFFALLPNFHPVPVQFYLGQTEIRLAFLLLAALWLGAALGALAGFGLGWKAARRVKNQ